MGKRRPVTRMLHEICSQLLAIEIRSALDIPPSLSLMPATDSDSTSAAAHTTATHDAQRAATLVRLATFLAHGKRLGVWIGLALVGTYAMGSAANHFSSGKKTKDQEAGGGGSGRNSSSQANSGMWWKPSGATSHSPASYNHSPSDAQGSSIAGSATSGTTSSSSFSGTLSLTNAAPIGSTASSQEAYAILGLRTSSSAPLAVSPSAGSFSNPTQVVRFSLSGNMSLVPTNNLEASGLSMSLVAVPEPATGAMLAIGMAGLALTRCRKSRETI